MIPIMMLNVSTQKRPVIWFTVIMCQSGILKVEDVSRRNCIKTIGKNRERLLYQKVRKLDMILTILPPRKLRHGHHISA